MVKRKKSVGLGMSRVSFGDCQLLCACMAETFHRYATLIKGRCSEV